MPAVLTRDPELSRQLRAAEKSTEWFLKHRDEYRGKFVVVHQGEFVSADEDPRVAKAAAKEAGVDLRECIIEFIPADDETCFY